MKFAELIVPPKFGVYGMNFYLVTKVLFYCHRYLLQSATVEIVNYYSQDQLSVMNATLDYTFSNGVLTIAQPASVADYEEAINSIVYNNTDEEPLSGVRMIRINVTDSPLFDTELDITNPSLMIANSSTSDSIKIL